MKKEIYYLVECDEAVNSDKSFKLKKTKSLKEYIGNLAYLNYKYEVYFCVWDNEKSEFYLKLNVTEEF